MITAEQARDLVEMRKNFVAAASSDVTQHPRMVQHALKRFADLKAQNPASSNYQFDFVHGIGRSLSGDVVHHVTGFLLDSSPPKDEIEPDRAGYFLEPGFQSPPKRKPEPGVEECYLFFGLSYSEQQENELMGLPAMVGVGRDAAINRDRGIVYPFPDINEKGPESQIPFREFTLSDGELFDRRLVRFVKEHMSWHPACARFPAGVSVGWVASDGRPISTEPEGPLLPPAA